MSRGATWVGQTLGPLRIVDEATREDEIADRVDRGQADRMASAVVSDGLASGSLSRDGRTLNSAGSLAGNEEANCDTEEDNLVAHCRGHPGWPNTDWHSFLLAAMKKEWRKCYTRELSPTNVPC